MSTLSTTTIDAASFDVYNATSAAVELNVAGWTGTVPFPATTGNVTNGYYQAEPGWTTIPLVGFDSISTLTISYAVGNSLYFNNFKVQEP